MIDKGVAETYRFDSRGDLHELGQNLSLMFPKLRGVIMPGLYHRRCYNVASVSLHRFCTTMEALCHF